MRTILCSALSASALLLSSCTTPVYYVVPREWQVPAKRDSLIQLYRPSLEGRKIFLDPGHGGEDRTNRGPAGEAIEADVNLRVGLALRTFLSAAGAEVMMSRDRDTLIALNDRWPMAVRAEAEVFVSLHHNATGTSDNVMNYASVYYHSRPGNPDYHPSNQDLARHIQRDMSYAMRNAGPPYSPTFDGTLSDYDIYPNAGFAVLRGNPIPAVLIEGSFFTHPHEERRLAIPEFNEIEAWGIFLGLGKYFRSGFPLLAMDSDTIVATPQFTIRLGARPWDDLDRRTLDVSFAGSELPGQFVDSLRSITVPSPSQMRSGTYDLEASVRSRSGKASWPFRRRLTVMLPAGAIEAGIHPPLLPPAAGASARVSIKVSDINGDPVADGMPVRLRSPLAGIDTTIGASGGRGIYYLTPPKGMADLPLEIEVQNQRSAVQVRVSPQPFPYALGVIRTEETGGPVPRAEVALLGSGKGSMTTAIDSADNGGRFVVADSGDGPRRLRATSDGYFPVDIPLPAFTGTPMEVYLTPVAAGRLHHRTFLVDPRYGGIESGGVSGTGLRASDVNLLVAHRLHTLLRQAGANVRLIRTNDTTIAEGERARRSTEFPRGFYLRIDAALSGRTADAEIYRNITNRRLAESILRALASFAALDTTPVLNSGNRFFNDVAMGTVSVRLPAPETGFYDSARTARIDRIAWGIFGGILRHAGLEADSLTWRYPAGTEEVTLGNLFTQIPDSAGGVDFFGLASPSIRPEPTGTPFSPSEFREVQK